MLYAGADACILVYSRTSKQSYKKLESWYNSFVERYPLQPDQVKTYPFVCIGNKQDLVRSTDTSNVVDEEEVETLLARLLPRPQPDIVVHQDQHPSSLSSSQLSCLLSTTQLTRPHLQTRPIQMKQKISNAKNCRTLLQQKTYTMQAPMRRYTDAHWRSCPTRCIGRTVADRLSTIHHLPA